MHERPPLTIGLVAGLVIGLTLLAINLILVRTAQSHPIGMNLYLTVLLLLFTIPLFLFWLYALIELLTIGYTIDRNGITLGTLFVRQTIPHDAVTEISSGAAIHTVGRFRGLSWPGFLRGRTMINRPPRLIMYSTEPLERQIILYTDIAAYGISPSDPEAFLDRLRIRRELGAIHPVPHTTVRLSLAAWPIWGDRVFWTAASLALVLNLALMGYTVGIYPDLPPIVPLHWDAQGMVDRLAPKAFVFVVPFIGTAVLAMNTGLAFLLHFRERFGARLLSWATVGVQSGLWLAALEILRP